MENKDIRWKQRFQNFKKAFYQLEKAVNTPDLNELERQGLIWKKYYEFLHPTRNYRIRIGIEG